MFKVQYTDEFSDWFAALSEGERETIGAAITLLEDFGPALPFPHSSGIRGSRHRHMRELRAQHSGNPYRILYAFDPKRSAILLIGGRKSGNRWYSRAIRVADRLYDEHLQDLGRDNS
jgi:hypothetical protein